MSRVSGGEDENFPVFVARSQIVHRNLYTMHRHKDLVEKMHKPSSRNTDLTGPEDGFQDRVGTLARPRICRQRTRVDSRCPFGAELLVAPKIVSIRVYSKCDKSNGGGNGTARPNKNILHHRPPHVGVSKNHKQRPGTLTRENWRAPVWGAVKSRFSCERSGAVEFDDYITFMQRMWLCGYGTWVV